MAKKEDLTGQIANTRAFGEIAAEAKRIKARR
jgi:hypothetical protein